MISWSSLILSWLSGFIHFSQLLLIPDLILFSKIKVRLFLFVCKQSVWWSQCLSLLTQTKWKISLVLIFSDIHHVAIKRFLWATILSNLDLCHLHFRNFKLRYTLNNLTLSSFFDGFTFCLFDSLLITEFRYFFNSHSNLNMFVKLAFHICIAWIVAWKSEGDNLLLSWNCFHFVF